MEYQLPARPTFWNVPHILEIAQYIFGLIAVFILLYGIIRYIRRWRSGRPEIFDLTWRQRIQALFKYGFLQARLSTEIRALIMHLSIFWGMVFLAIGTALATIDWDVTYLIFDFQFLRGNFYLWYELFLDIAGLALISGLFIAIYRRYILNLERLKTILIPTFPLDSFYLIAMLLVIAITGFIVEGLRLAVNDVSWEISAKWAFAGYGLSKLFRSIPDETIKLLHIIFWSVHAFAAFVFIASIPFSKAFHMIASGVSIALRKFDNPGYLTQNGGGVRFMSDFTWRQIVQFDGCTWCGRCQDVCPAYKSGQSLSPKNLILKLHKQHTIICKGNDKNSESKVEIPSLHGLVITADELWSCTTCIACETVCPVFIEQPRAIVDLRRHLVSEGEIDKGVQDALMNLQRYGNSVGQSDRNRARWTQNLPFKIKDARKEPVEYLWFVGDYASYDLRIQEITKTMANLFNSAGIDFGILYESERNSGNDVRRLGEEGLFEMLVEKNIAVLQKIKFDQIVTTDPHTFNTLRNEYPKYGASFKVLHYTQLLHKLIKDGKLIVKNNSHNKITYHDPCYLGRYNDVYEEPREILRSVCAEFIEMPRNRKYSHCCGAGGGRIWMEDKPGIQERPSESRVREAVSLAGVEILSASCPKDIIMFQDAVKTTKNDEKIIVKDIAELVWESIH